MPSVYYPKYVNKESGMTDMTPEQLDAARYTEASERALVQVDYSLTRIFQIYRELVRSDWRPTDPDVLAVREICAQESEAQLIGMGGVFRSGEADADRVMRCALAAYRAGREAGR